MKSIITIAFVSFSTIAFAGGNSHEHHDSNSNNSSGNISTSQGQMQGQSQSLKNVNLNQVSNTSSFGLYNQVAASNAGVNTKVEGSKSFSIGASSAPTPATCTAILPEFFGAVTITYTMRYDCGIAVAMAYVKAGKDEEGIQILNKIRVELDF